MALLDTVTVGEKTVLQVDASPTASGVAADPGSLAMFRTGGNVGEVYIKTGLNDTDWDKISTAGASGLGLGNFRNLAIYNTSPNGYSLDDQILQNTQTIDVTIIAQPTRSANIVYTIPNPGDAVTAADFVLTEGNQTINGNKTFGNNVTINGILTAATGSTLTNIQSLDLIVSDKLITLNKGGLVATADLAGLEFEEASTITGYFKISSTRNGWIFKSPIIASTETLSQSLLTSSRTLNFPNVDGTIVAQATVPAGVAQQVAFWTGTSVISNPTGVSTNSLYWDSTNFRLGIGNSAPATTLNVTGTTLISGTSSQFQIIGNTSYKQKTDTVLTTNATTTTLALIPVTASDTMIMCKTMVVCRKTGGAGVGAVGDGGAYERTARIQVVAGVLSVFTLQSDFTSETAVMAGMNVAIDILSTDIRVRVVGLASDNITWESITTLVELI